MANLWDVTDKDIDRFSKKLLESWGLFDDDAESMSLSEALSGARDICQLKYLVGAAPIIYGIPVVLMK